MTTVEPIKLPKPAEPRRSAYMTRRPWDYATNRACLTEGYAVLTAPVEALPAERVNPGPRVVPLAVDAVPLEAESTVLVDVTVFRRRIREAAKAKRAAGREAAAKVERRPGMTNADFAQLKRDVAGEAAAKLNLRHGGVAVNPELLEPWLTVLPRRGKVALRAVDGEAARAAGLPVGWFLSWAHVDGAAPVRFYVAAVLVASPEALPELLP
jgi:hypothetical protein